jgi:putative transposase
LQEYIVVERVFQPLLFLLARCSRNELIRQIEFLKAENEMLRKRIPTKYVTLKPEEREKLIKLGDALGPILRRLITIVAYSSYYRWKRMKEGPRPVKNHAGRPKTPEAIREFVIKLAKETGWGYTRILGELRKLEIGKISRQTVVNILKKEGLEPGPKRGPGTWDQMLKMHAETLWQCDFFSKRALCRRGITQVFAMVLINVATRKVWVSSSTAKVTPEWVEQQTRTFLDHVGKEAMQVGIVSRDRDHLYRGVFDKACAEQGAKVKVLTFRSPNLNAYVERFIQSLQVECLNHFLVFGEKHLDYLVREYVEHYHYERPHQGLGNRPVLNILGKPDGKIQCRTRLGDLLRHYCRAA